MKDGACRGPVRCSCANGFIVSRTASFHERETMDREFRWHPARRPPIMRCDDPVSIRSSPRMFARKLIELHRRQAERLAGASHSNREMCAAPAAAA